MVFGIAQYLWERILEVGGTEPFLFQVGWTCFFTIGTYWLFGGLFLFVDITGKPDFMKKYKVQENVKSYPLSASQVIDLLKVVNFNLFFGTIFVTSLMVGWNQYRGHNAMTQELPSLFTLLVHASVFVILTELFFYYSHRVLHHPLIYKHIHKKHHTWISPVAFSAAYAHPIEHIISNVLAVGLGSLVLRSHISILWAYIIAATVNTLTVHSGYHLPLLNSPEFHDFHHLKFNYNFGVIGLMDWIHGTDSLFRQSKQFLRHETLYSTTPIKALVP